jgi:tetratricopeptide (TPR) repeat protein
LNPTGPALGKFEEAARLYRALDNRKGAARSLLEFSLVSNKLGDKTIALRSYEQVLPVFQALAQRSDEARVLNGIGEICSDFGDKQKALTYFDRALELERGLGDKSGETETDRRLSLIKIGHLRIHITGRRLSFLETGNDP